MRYDIYYTNQPFGLICVLTAQGFILLPHLFELGGNLYSHFIISILHLISAGILALGGIYHAIVGAERLEETSYSSLFAYGLQDRFRITAILGSHLLTLGIGAALLFAKAVYLGGLYDTWAHHMKSQMSAPSCLALA